MTEPDCNLDDLKRILGSADPLPPAYLDFVAQDTEAKRVSDGFERLDALLRTEPEPPRIDVTRSVMAQLGRQQGAGWASWLGLAAAVAVALGLAASFFAPTPIDSLGSFVSDPLAVETGYARPELPLAPLVDTPSAWLDGVLEELRAAVPRDALPQAPFALIVLLAPLVLALNWFVGRGGTRVAGGIA